MIYQNGASRATAEVNGTGCTCRITDVGRLVEQMQNTAMADIKGACSAQGVVFLGHGLQYYHTD